MLLFLSLIASIAYACRLIFIHELVPDPANGSDVRLVRIIDYAVSFGCNVTLVSRRNSNLTVTSGGLLAGYKTKYKGRAYVLEPDSPQFQQMIEEERFDAAFIPVWFWYKGPSAIEAYSPVIKRISNTTRVVAISDDCEIARHFFLARLEPSWNAQARWLHKLSNLTYRLQSIYRDADKVTFITQRDFTLCRTAYPGVLMSKSSLLRVSPDSTVPPRVPNVDRVPTKGAPRLIFLGNGLNPSNYLPMHLFLRNVWGSIRDKFPGATLHIVGTRPESGGQCLQGRRLYCGWAWNTTFADREAENGIIVEGYVENLDKLMNSMLAMIVPIPPITGVNTKILTGFSYGLPIILPRGTGAGFEISGQPNDLGLIEVGGPTTWVGAIQKLMDNAKWRRQVSRDSIKHLNMLLRVKYEMYDLKRLLQRMDIMAKTNSTEIDSVTTSNSSMPVPAI